MPKAATRIKRRTVALEQDFIDKRVRRIADPKKPIELKYTAGNFLIAPNTGLPVTIQIPGR